MTKQEQAATAPTGFKLAVCDWTIGKKADPGSFEVAKRIELDGVQVDFGSGDNRLPLFDEELQQQMLKEARKRKMEIASLAMGVLNNVPYKSDPRAERWVRQGINVAEAMEVKVILLAFFGKGDLKNDEQGIAKVVQRLRQIAPYAETAGVTLGIESWLSAEQHVDIIERVGSPAVKVYYDVANSNKAGYDIYKEIRQLGPHICEFHAKDYDDLYGKGSIDFEEVRRAMDDIGYRGWLVMEGTKMPLGVEESCRYDAEYLRGIFPKKV
jgi:sugar phosphate isomerase/epimerase